MALIPPRRQKSSSASALPCTLRRRRWQRMSSHVQFSSAQILWERSGVIYLRRYLRGILSIVRSPPLRLDGRRRGQSQGREQRFAAITQCSEPVAAVNRISLKVTSSGSRCNCQRKLQSFFSPLNAGLKCAQPQFPYMFLVCEETTEESFPCQEKLLFPPEPGIDPGSPLQS